LLNVRLIGELCLRLSSAARCYQRSDERTDAAAEPVGKEPDRNTALIAPALLECSKAAH
jgi:hypothetical protein